MYYYQPTIPTVFYSTLQLICFLEKAVLQYEFLGNEVMDLYHTEVPGSQRGKGMAGHLVKVHVYIEETLVFEFHVCFIHNLFREHYHNYGHVSYDHTVYIHHNTIIIILKISAFL